MQITEAEGSGEKNACMHVLQKSWDRHFPFFVTGYQYIARQHFLKYDH